MIDSNESFAQSTSLYLFNNFTEFKNFRHGAPHVQYLNVHNYTSKGTKQTMQLVWTFNVTEESQYYVGINVENGATVLANVSIIRVYYNTSGLKEEHCITNNLSDCSLKLCSSFICGKRFFYIAIETSQSAELTYI